MHKAQDKPAQAAAALKFFDWAYRSGDDTASQLDYVPMPDPVVSQVEKLWSSQLKDSAGNPIAYK